MARISKAQIAEREEAIARCREWMPEGSTVFTVLDRVSASGMTRHIRLVIIKCVDGKPIDLHPNHAAATVLGWKQDPKRDGIKVQGCGMDMGFHLVYSLASALYGNGYALKQRWL
jgi:hypothetical protein